MNITTPRIDASVRSILKRYEIPGELEKSAVKAKHRETVQDESLVESTTLCNSSGQQADTSRHEVANAELLKKQLGDQFTNINVMRATSCSINSIVTQLPLGSLSLQESVNEYITNPRQVGSESVFGYALLSGFGEASNMMIAKTPRKGKGSDLKHELFVALNGTNKMRALGIPNFAIVYGGSNCSKAIIDPVTKKVVNWCSKSVEGSVPYAFYENISPGKSAADYTRTANSNRIVSMFVQFVLAEAMAYEKIGFTHYDAHNENIIMRDGSAVAGSGVYQVKYSFMGVPIYVKMDAIATYIDYGLSCIRYGDEYIGTTDPATERILVYSDRPYPLHDVYKFLMFTLRSLPSTRPKQQEAAYKWLSKMVMFFNNTESVETIVNKQWNYRYSLPYVSTASRDIHHFIKFMLENISQFNDIVSFRQQHKNIPLLQCEKCWTFAGLQRELNKSEPSSLIELYDRDIRDYENIRQLRNKHITTMKTIVAKAEDLIVGRSEDVVVQSTTPVRSQYNTDFHSVKAPEIQQPKYAVADVSPIVQKLMSNRTKIFTLLGFIDRASLYIDVAEWFVKYYEDGPLLTALRLVVPRVMSLKRDLCMLIREYETQLSIIDEQEDKWLSSDEARDVFLIKTCKVVVDENTKEGMIDDPEKSSWYILGAEESLQPIRMRQDSRALLPRDMGI